MGKLIHSTFVIVTEETEIHVGPTPETISVSDGQGGNMLHIILQDPTARIKFLAAMMAMQTGIYESDEETGIYGSDEEPTESSLRDEPSEVTGDADKQADPVSPASGT